MRGRTENAVESSLLLRHSLSFRKKKELIHSLGGVEFGRLKLRDADDNTLQRCLNIDKKNSTLTLFSRALFGGGGGGKGVIVEISARIKKIVIRCGEKSMCMAKKRHTLGQNDICRQEPIDH